MKRLTIALVLLVILMASSAIIAAPGKLNIGVAVIGLEHNWDITCFNASVARLKELGVTVTGLDGERQTAKHIANLETLLQTKPDAIIIILGYSQIMDPVMKKIQDAKIPIITCDFTTEFSVCNVSSSNQQMGSMIAEKMAADLGYKGNIVSFFRPGSPVAEARRAELAKVLTKYPDLKVAVEQPYIVPGTVPDAMAKMESILIANSKPGAINAVWSLFDQPVIGAAMAIEAAGKAGQIKVYGIDGDPLALDLIKRGVMTATIMQQPGTIGKLAAEQAVKLANGEKVDKQIFVDVTLITKDNVDQYIKK